MWNMNYRRTDVLPLAGNPDLQESIYDNQLPYLQQRTAHQQRPDLLPGVPAAAGHEKLDRWRWSASCLEAAGD